MKTWFHLNVVSLIVTTMFAEAYTLYSAPAEPSTNAPVVVSNTIPQSVFTIPANPKEGRDPFFPNSTRDENVPHTKSASAGISSLVLNGLSGPPEHRLAMINGHTLAQGEETEITISGSQLRVRCVEIKEDSVTVEVAGERHELHLRSGV